MRIAPPKIDHWQGVTRCSVEFEHAGGRGELRYEVRGDAGSLACDAVDPFLVALLPIAMDQREDVVVEAPVSERLLYHLTQHFQAVATTGNPALSSVLIHAPVLDRSQPPRAV